MIEIGAKVGRYVLESLLGRGGMGEVYRAHDPDLHRPVALKVLLSGAGEDDGTKGEWTARMIREARAAAAFNHPNAVVVYDVGEQDGLPFIVMELVDGQSLRGLVGDADIPIARRIRWLVEAGRALAAAHAAGLVHRDVKPDNVMVTKDGSVKILDFGIARRRAGATDPDAPTLAVGIETVTRTGAVLGTPLYMAPEQLRSRPLDGRTDQFAWAVMAYELLSGSPPWSAHGAMDLAGAILQDDPPPLGSRVADLPEGVEAAITRALAKRPEDRFPSMDEAVAAIDPGAARETSARPAVTSAGPALSVSAKSAAALAPAVSAATAPASAPASRGRRVVVAIAVAAIAAGASALILGRTPAARTVASASAPASVSASAPINAPGPAPLVDPIPRHPCEQRPDAGPYACPEPLVGWCDAMEKPIACCAPELAATGEDGICGCPPGGTKQGLDASAGCAEHVGDGAAAIQAVMRGSFGGFRKCYEKALERAKMQGSVALGFELTPEGRVFSARVARSTLPDGDAQACLVRLVRGLRFEPPAGGRVSVIYPIVFSPGDD